MPVVRLKERRKRISEGSARRLYFFENNDEVTEQLRASVDFPVDLCDSISNPDDANFTNWSHQAVDFILVLYSMNICH
uniref:Protein multipolar spindle 1 isoform X2 n=1 Tax=Tanacetum cinerariifolium TaxID=118510 RepID=A0A699IIU8_TANCI|nr:protein multipolar spindle 1 isoform X2 [Tanacetum cinerariifolium]